MHILSCLALFIASVAAHRSCGNVDVPDYLKSEVKGFSRVDAHEMSKKTQKVKVYYHNVYINRTEAGGYLTSDQLKRQFRAMNKHYACTGIHFDLRRIIHTKNTKWATFDPSNDPTGIGLEMKKKLRKGSYADLNVYFRQALGGGDLLGKCPFPIDVTPKSDNFYLDGCDVLYSTIPGGKTQFYDEGKTATHEVGHWFGLFHTFQDGCDGGDMVADTPAQMTATTGCPIGKDTCTGPKYPGLDPIHNYMDYSYDSCLNQFTPGQAARIYQMWDRFRAPFNH